MKTRSRGFGAMGETRRNPSAILLDDLVGEVEDRGWDRHADRLGGLQVDDKQEFGWLLDREISGLGALQDFVDITGGNRAFSMRSGP